jgi:hypothetical protein
MAFSLVGSSANTLTVTACQREIEEEEEEETLIINGHVVGPFGLGLVC